MEDKHRTVVEAQEFRLVDSGGNLPALITSSDTWNGEPSITLFDRQGLNRLVLEMHNDTPRITLFAPSGQPVAGLGVHEEGGTSLALNRENGTLGFYVRVPTNADAKIQTFDEGGQPMG